jgi:hypothetical protein
MTELRKLERAMIESIEGDMEMQRKKKKKTNTT